MNLPSKLRAFLLALACAGALVASAGAFAHAGLVNALPAAGSQVSGASRIELTFNEALVPRAVRVTLSKVGAGGALAKVEHVGIEVLDGNRIVRATPRHAPGPGVYEVEWRVVGADNHPMIGRHRFTIR